MAATLNVQFTEGADFAAYGLDRVEAVVRQAFNEWSRHFDYTTGNYTINVSFRARLQPTDVRLSGDSYVKVSPNGRGLGTYETGFGLSLAGRSGRLAPAPTLFVNPGYLTGALSLGNAVAPIERELGHALGIRAFIQNTIFVGTVHQFTQTVYDTSVVFGPFSPDTTFNGPNAQAVYGGPVPVVSADPSTTTVGGKRAVTTAVDGASSLQPLDVALLRDAGLPALSDQEIGEHQVARLYVAAFGRNADSAGLVAQYRGLQNGLSLAQLGDGIVASAEFTNRYGTGLSNADFVDALYQNVLGRAGDASGVATYRNALARGVSRGTILAAFADSDEERGRLNAATDPNVTYAGTAEAQVARAYDTAFGRDADPGGFVLYTTAVINGTTLQQAAMSFIGSAEFANRYGAAPSDQALVDAFYQNTLHRAPDAAGEALFVRALASGQFSRADLFVSFSESQEHVNLMAQAAGARDASLGYTLDLRPHLGIIPTIVDPGLT